MIVNGPQLIACRHQFGYNRYGWAPTKDRNYTLPDGRGAYINGIVAEVPPGTDINPYNSEAQDQPGMNAMSISGYTPPQTIDYIMEISGLASGGVHFKADTDLKIYDMSGKPIDLFGTFSPRMHVGSFSYFMGATVGNTGLNVSPKIIRCDYKSPRGGYIELIEYEQGPDGITTFEILSGNPYAVKAKRLSDQTTQTVSGAGLIVPAGAGQIEFRVTWASGLPATNLLAKVKFSIEVPYGI